MGKPYEVERLHGRPIVEGETIRALGIGTDQSRRKKFRGDAMFPMVIRVPDWVPLDRRPDARANYYLYFASHHGPSIHFAWADRVDSPDWAIFNAGDGMANDMGGQGDPVPGRGVFDLDLVDPLTHLDLADGVFLTGHVSSPDVWVDHANQRFIMVLHGKSHSGQKSFVATSKTGLNFNLPEAGGEPGHGIRRFVFAHEIYLRLFEYDSNFYALSTHGHILRPCDPESLWDAPEGHDPAEALWESSEVSPIAADLEAAGLAGEGIENGLSLRHGSVRVLANGKTLEIFYSRRWDMPERIVRSTADLSVGDWQSWKTSFPPDEILRQEVDWEGDPERDSYVVHDSYVFEDVDGQVYLFYSCKEEDALAVAKLHG